MNEHTHAIRRALEEFVKDPQVSPSTGISVVQANDPPKVITAPSGLTDDIHAVVFIPEFDKMPYGERQRLVWDYLKASVPLDHLKHLSLLRTVDSDEWEELPGLPLQEWTTIASGR